MSRWRRVGTKKAKKPFIRFNREEQQTPKPILPIFISNPEEAQRVSPHTHFGTRLNVRQLRCVISHSKLVVRATFNPVKHKEKKQSANNSSARSHRIDKFKICLGRISLIFSLLFFCYALLDCCLYNTKEFSSSSRSEEFSALENSLVKQIKNFFLSLSRYLCFSFTFFIFIFF